MQREVGSAADVSRAWPWLPDAASHAHPVATWLLEMSFDLWLGMLYRRETVFPDAFSIDPGTVIASNHQRDLDGPLLAAAMVQRRGLRFRRPLLFFATREDLFRTGGLAHLASQWSWPLSTFVQRASLDWVFRLGHAEPMRRVREYTLGEALRVLCAMGCGGDDCASVLNERGRRELGVSPGTSRLREAAKRVDAPMESWWGLRRLNLSTLRRLAPSFRATVGAQLACFAAHLDAGRCVYFAPEGSIAADGRFGRIRAGLFRVCGATARATWIQPIGLGYDPLASGRTRVVLRLGARFRADTAVGQRAFKVALRRTICALTPVTPSHLLARFLLHVQGSFTRAELIDWLARGREALLAEGVALDPLLARASMPGLACRRLRWLRRKRLVVRATGALRSVCPCSARPGWDDPENIVVYLDNNLADLVPDVERVLPC